MWAPFRLRFVEVGALMLALGLLAVLIGASWRSMTSWTGGE